MEGLMWQGQPRLRMFSSISQRDGRAVCLGLVQSGSPRRQEWLTEFRHVVDCVEGSSDGARPVRGWSGEDGCRFGESRNSRACGALERGRFPRDHGEASYGDDFFTHVVEPNDFRRSPLIEVAPDCISDFVGKLSKGVGLGENRHPQRACDKPSLRSFLDHEDQFTHLSHPIPPQRCPHGSPPHGRCPVRQRFQGMIRGQHAGSSMVLLADFLAILRKMD